MNKLIGSIVVLGLALWLNGCGGTPPTKPAEKVSPPTPVASAAAFPSELFLKEAPADAKEVSVVKKEAKEGDEVVVRGRIGGSENPFVDGRAVVTIADTSIRACNERPGDACPNPWDFCCEDPNELVMRTATIQVLDKDGKPLKQGLRGVNGIDHLTVLAVKGKVDKRGDPKVLTINASGIYIDKTPAKKTN